MDTAPATCPVNGMKGKIVKTITLKALLNPKALATLEPSEQQHFCPDPECPVVYFGLSQTYRREDLKVTVFQKDSGADVPVCYCFAHTRQDLEQATRSGTAAHIPHSIRDHIQAGRCGCEVNNPQGSCCLGNVTKTLKHLESGQA
jgi:hypothetical protein